MIVALSLTLNSSRAAVCVLSCFLFRFLRFSQHIVQLHEELNIAAAQGDLSKSNWKSTSLAPHIEYFREFVTKLSNDCREATMNKQQKQQQGTKQAGTQDIGQSRTYTQRTGSSLPCRTEAQRICVALCVSFSLVIFLLSHWLSSCLPSHRISLHIVFDSWGSDSLPAHVLTLK